MSIEKELKEEVNKKKYSLNIVRNARINDAKRLLSLSKRWEGAFQVHNFMNILFFTLALLQDFPKYLNLIIGLYAIAIILLQNHINGYKYESRSTMFTYCQLSIEKSILELKALQREINIIRINKDILKNLELKYSKIMHDYNDMLILYENHTKKSYLVAKQNYKKEQKYKFIFALDIEYNLPYISYLLSVIVIVFLYFLV